MNISVSIKGLGSEVCQGSLPTNKLENFKSSDLSWNDFCQKELELDGYWEINNVNENQLVGGQYKQLDGQHIHSVICSANLLRRGNLNIEEVRSI